MTPPAPPGHARNRCGREWRPIPGHEGTYEVSDQGRVRSLPRLVATGGHKSTCVRWHGPSCGCWRKTDAPRVVPEKILRPTRRGRYPTVNLRSNGRRESARVHVLVARAFLGPRPDGAIIRHLNDDPLDNRRCNLAYGTPADNSADTVRNGLNINANKTHCPSGHEYAGHNLVIGRRGDGTTFRACRQCKDGKARRPRTEAQVMTA